VIAVDTNILVYATIPSLPHHSQAKEWLDARLNGSTPVGLPWHVLVGFLRLVTNPRVFTDPVTSVKAWEVVEYWLNCPVVWIPQPGEEHAAILKQLYSRYTIQGNLVPDAHLAAIAIEHGLILYSSDHDFARFRELKWENPIE